MTYTITIETHRSGMKTNRYTIDARDQCAALTKVIALTPPEPLINVTAYRYGMGTCKTSEFYHQWDELSKAQQWDAATNMYVFAMGAGRVEDFNVDMAATEYLSERHYTRAWRRTIG